MQLNTVLRSGCLALSLGLIAAPFCAAQTSKQNERVRGTQQAMIEHGRYLVQIAGCNDCHTPGYAQAGGKVDEKLWLTGDILGWRGPWGTTYSSNLRLYMQTLSEAEWLKVARTKPLRPPMPWFNLQAMTERDLRAIYQYVRAAGPAGQPAPAYLPPSQEPKPPFARFP